MINLFSHCLVFPNQCSLKLIFRLSLHWFPISNWPNTQFTIPPRFGTSVISQPCNSTQKHCLSFMGLVFDTLFQVFHLREKERGEGEGRRRGWEKEPLLIQMYHSQEPKELSVEGIPATWKSVSSSPYYNSSNQDCALLRKLELR